MYLKTLGLILENICKKKFKKELFMMKFDALKFQILSRLYSDEK